MTNEKPSRFLADLAGSYAALKRAGERARRLAEQTGTKLIVAPRTPTPKTSEAKPRS